MHLEQRSNDQVRVVLGKRLRGLRRSRGFTQAELAERAGLSRPTISTLERGKDVNLDSFLSVLRALELLDVLDASLPEPAVSPMGELERFSRRRRVSGDPTPALSEWAWGDES